MTEVEADATAQVPHRRPATSWCGAPTVRAPWPAGGFELEGYAMAFAWNIVCDADKALLLRLPVPAGHGLQRDVR